MPIIQMPPKRARAIAIRPEDRFLRSDDGARQENSGALGLLIGSAIVAGSVIGLLMYDAQRPFGYGTAPAPALVIPVEPAR